MLARGNEIAYFHGKLKVGEEIMKEKKVCDERERKGIKE